MPEPNATPNNPPAAPSAGSPPASSPASASQGAAGFFDAEIDAMDKAPDAQPGAPKPAPKKGGKEAPPTPKPDAISAQKESKASESLSKDTEQAGSTTKDAGTSSEKPPVKAAELRAAYEERKKEVKALKAELETLKKAKPAEDPERKTLLERLEAKEKRIKELEDTVKFKSWEDGDEYKNQYLKPYQAAYSRGRQATAQLKVLGPDGEVLREGTAKDFDDLMSMPDEQVGAKATEMYGANAALVLARRERVREILDANQEAKDNFLKTAEERQKADVEKQALTKKQQEEAVKHQAETFNKFITEDAEKYPQWFKPTDGDDAGNKLLEKGRNLAAAVFGGNGNLSQEQRVRNDAYAFGAIMAFPRVTAQLKAAQGRIQSLEAELGKFKESASAGGGTKRTPGEQPKSDEAEIDELDTVEV